MASSGSLWEKNFRLHPNFPRFLRALFPACAVSPLHGKIRGMTRRMVCCLLLWSGCACAQEQDNEAVLNALVQKGLITNGDIEQGRADATRAAAERAGRVIPWGRETQRLSLGMLMMIQYSGLSTTRGAAANSETISHFMVRRAVMVLQGRISDDWSAVFGYNFATQSPAVALFQWTVDPELRLNVGLRKVSLGYEEYSAPDQMRAIETAPVTRYFVESNNGLRLGAASYRMGVFLAGTHGSFTYGGAVTNAERMDDLSMFSNAGNKTNNRPAFWADAGYSRHGEFGSLSVGVAAGFLPGQGGPGNDHRGEGYDLTVGSAFADLEAGRYSFLAEYFAANVERGASLARDASPSGFYLQPGFMLTPKLEAVLRYSWIDSDGRGVDLADAVRSAPSSGVMDTVGEWYCGGNWYIRHSDLKLSLGVLYAKGRAGMNAIAATARTYGVRSQMQVNF